MKEISNPTARELIILLLEKGPQQRLELSRQLGVQPSTVTRVVNQLLEQNYLIEMPDPGKEGRRGFPSKRLYLESGKLLSAGIFISPDHVFCCIVDMLGDVLSEASHPIRDASFEAVMKDVSEVIADHMTNLGKSPEDFLGCGISYPGRHITGPYLSQDASYLPNWPQVQVKDKLASYFDMPVYQLNDAKSACLAEMLFGNCRTEENFCYVWLAHGLGGAAVVDKRLYLGTNGNAAEFGTLYPKTKPRPSGRDLLQFLNQKGIAVEKLADISGEVLESPHIDEWCERAETQLRELCHTIACTYAPEKIAFGGQLPDPIFARLLEGLNREIPAVGRVVATPPKIVRAMMDKRPQLGAAAVPLYVGTRHTNK